MATSLVPRVRILAGPHAGRIVSAFPSDIPGHVDVYLGTGVDEGFVALPVDMVEQVR